MWLNRTSQSAIRAVLYVADHSRDGPVRVDDIARALAAPRNYLSKTLHALMRAGVLRSVRGRGGGFELAVAPDRLPVGRVIAPFQPMEARRCLTGRPECSSEHPCLAHRHWERVANTVSEFFENTTIADLLARPSGTRAPRAKRVRPRNRRSIPIDSR